MAAYRPLRRSHGVPGAGAEPVCDWGLDIASQVWLYSPVAVSTWVERRAT
jgi:hypothetical protein